MVLVPSLLLATRVAHAEPSEGEKKAAAQALFDEARALTGKGQHAEACPKLAESLRLDPSMGTRFYLAECFERVGKLASAWTYYLEVADAAKAAGQKDREKYAADRAEALRPRLPRLSIKVLDGARAAGLEIKRDGVIVGDAQWGSPIPIDLGKHTVTAGASGKRPWALDLDVQKEAQIVEVVVPALADIAPAAPAPPPPVRAPKPLPPPPPPPPASMPPQRIAGWALTIAGAGALGTSFVLGGLAIAKKGESNQGGCDADSNVCNSAGLELRQSALGLATGSTAAFIGGLAAAGAGVALIVTSSPKKRAPIVAVHPSGASLTWRW